MRDDWTTLRLAAKAVDFCYDPTITLGHPSLYGGYSDDRYQSCDQWNPMEFMDQAFELAIRLKMTVIVRNDETVAEAYYRVVRPGHDPDLRTFSSVVENSKMRTKVHRIAARRATCMAICLCAAQVGQFISESTR